MATLIYCRNGSDGQFDFGHFRLYHGKCEVRELEPREGKSMFTGVPEWEAGREYNSEDWVTLPVMLRGRDLTSVERPMQYESCLRYFIDYGDSECHYKPLILTKDFGVTSEVMEILRKNCEACGGLWKSPYEFYSKFFDIPRMQELYALSVKHHSTTFVVRDDIDDLYIGYTGHNQRKGILIRTKDVKNVKRLTWDVPWKERYKSDFTNTDMTSWVKFLKASFPVGDNGMALIDLPQRGAYDLWPQDSDIKNRLDDGELISFDIPSKYSEEYKEEVRLRAEREKREREERERMKMMPYHCCKCGSGNAEHVKDPFRDLDGWYCPDCYSDMM